MPSVDFAALSARYPGGIPEADRPRAEAALEDATSAVLVEAGLDPDAPVPGPLASLTLRVARREFANPLDMASETLADYTWRADGIRVGGLLTETERREIRRIMGYGDIVSVRTPLRWDVEDVQRITPTELGGFNVWPDGGTS